MNRCIRHLSCYALALVLMGGHQAFSDPPPAKDPQKSAEPKKPDSAEAKPEAAAKPATVKVKKAPLKIEVGLDGVFEAQTMTEILLRPQEWSGLTVLSAVEHGAAVKRGDLLVALDMEKIDRAIADLRSDQQAADLSIQQADQTLRMLEATTPLDVALSQRAERVASEDQKLFFGVHRPMLLKSIDFMLKMAQDYLEYQQEELKQLEKMYKADDLTEDTEEIVLKRVRNAVERAKFMFERAKIEHEEALKYDVPRMDEKIKDSAQRTALQWERDKIAIPLALKKLRMDLEKLKLQRARGDERLNKLLADREIMTVKAPVDGVVYYGKCTRGKWGGSGAGIEELRRGSSLSANAVFMTIVQPRPMFIRASVPEKELHQVRAGVKGTAKPAGYPDLKLAVIVERVATVPGGAGGFDSRITVALDRQAEALMPGMSCEVKLVVYEKQDALSVPAAAVAPDEANDQKFCVQTVDKDGKTNKQEVTVGKRADKQVEILAGLREGDEILAEYPKEKK